MASKQTFLEYSPKRAFCTDGWCLLWVSPHATSGNADLWFACQLRVHLLEALRIRVRYSLLISGSIAKLHALDCQCCGYIKLFLLVS